MAIPTKHEDTQLTKKQVKRMNKKIKKAMNDSDFNQLSATEFYENLSISTEVSCY